MDELISRKALDDAFTELRWNEDGTLNHFGDRPDWCMHGSDVDKLIQNAPSVPAVPLDKLCEWLAKFGCPCDINEDMCDQAHGVDRCLGIFNSSAFCWQYLLTKMMEEQDAPN